MIYWDILNTKLKIFTLNVIVFIAKKLTRAEERKRVIEQAQEMLKRLIINYYLLF